MFRVSVLAFTKRFLDSVLRQICFRARLKNPFGSRATVVEEI